MFGLTLFKGLLHFGLQHVHHVLLILLDDVLQKEYAALQFLLKTLHFCLVLGGLSLFQLLLKTGKRSHGLVFQLTHAGNAFLAELGFLIELGNLHHAELRNGLLRLGFLVAAAKQRKHGHKRKSGNYVSVHSLSPVMNVLFPFGNGNDLKQIRFLPVLGNGAQQRKNFYSCPLRQGP